jgi:hypothetical protein
MMRKTQPFNNLLEKGWAKITTDGGKSSSEAGRAKNNLLEKGWTKNYNRWWKKFKRSRLDQNTTFKKRFKRSR